MTEMTSEEWAREIIKMANANEARTDGTMKSVLEIIADNDVVMAVWQDASLRGGFGALPIKGANLMRDIVASGSAQQLTLTGIKCTCAEQAEALRRHVAADRTH